MAQNRVQCTRVWKARSAESHKGASYPPGNAASAYLTYQIKTREGVQMRRVLSLLLTVAMMLSLVVVAGAAESGKVDLVITPKATNTANVVQFDVKLVPQNVTEIGAFQFTLTAQNCTIDRVVYLNNGEDGTQGGGLQFYKEKVGAEDFVNGYFEKFGGEITSNKTVYKFLAAGTAKNEYTYGGVTYPAHIWRNPTETLILTLQVTMNDGAKNCSLAVDTTAGSSGRFTVGQSVDVGNGKYEVKDACTGVATSEKYGADDVLLGDVNGDGEVDNIDAALIYAYFNDKCSFTEEQLSAGDVNGDEVVDNIDAALIYAYFNEVISKFPAEA